MNDLQRILKEITEVTLTIETKYPELYRNLEENPMTLPTNKDPKMDKKVIQDYLESLKQLLEHHIETHKTNNSK